MMITYFWKSHEAAEDIQQFAEQSLDALGFLHSRLQVGVSPHDFLILYGIPAEIELPLKWK